tara:strand:- start:1951 stop:3846 length:1896 start_codon:yes stop_codon:yes gene_type:complete
MKKFCVLQVTPSEPNPKHVQYFFDQEECDFFFVTHDEPNKKALKYCPNTTWTDTRNVLAALVPQEYEYYAFVDYDYNFRPLRQLDVKQQILEDLNEYNPAVLTYYPGKGMITPYASNIEHRDSKDASILPFSHCGMKVVHHSLMKWFFPMITNFGGGVEACHLFNILEIPFLRHVVCSHKMVYDNGNTDMEAPHNLDGAWNDYRMNEMWKWLRPAFKKTNVIDRYARQEQHKYHALLIKHVFQDIAMQNKLVPVKNHNIKNYFNRDTIELFFNLEHEHFSNLEISVRKQLLDIDQNNQKIINEILSKITFKQLKTTNNPWIEISKRVNKATKDCRKITTSECVDMFQRNLPESLFVKSSNINNDLLKYIKNKKVAFVGPAPYMRGLGRGELIDSYDVIVRIQQGIPNEQDYGSRTDIIQSCLNSNYGPPLVEHLKNMSVESRPKFIICNDTASQIKADGSWAMVDEIYEPIFSELEVPFVHLKNSDSTWDRWALYWEIYAKQHIEKFDKGIYTVYSANFNSGYGALNMLLRYPIKELAVFGLDFYSAGTPQTDEGKYSKQYTDTYGKSGTPNGPDKVLHDQISQMMHCRNVLLKDNRFKLDKPVLTMLNSISVTKRINDFILLPKFKNETR